MRHTEIQERRDRKITYRDTDILMEKRKNPEQFLEKSSFDLTDDEFFLCNRDRPRKRKRRDTEIPKHR